MAGIVPFSGEGSMLAPIINPSEMIEAHERLREWVSATLKPGRDYDTLPGTDKSVILKPGVDRLLAGFQLKASYQILSEEVEHDRLNVYDAGKWVKITDPGRAEKERLNAAHPGKYRNRKDRNGNWEFQERIEEEGKSLGLYRYQVKCSLTDRIGEVVSEAIGICSSLEAKYIRAPRDAEHTILMMAMKRARTAAVTSLLGLSEIFEAEDDIKPSQRMEEPNAPSESDTNGYSPTTIKGLVVVLREWDLNPVKEKDLKTLCLDRGLKLVDAIAEAQRTDGPSAIASLDAFLDWLGRVHPAADPVQEEQQ